MTLSANEELEYEPFFFTGFDAPPFSSEKVTQFMDNTKQMYQKMIGDGKDSKVWKEIRNRTGE